MKKTFTALAVLATAVISGAATQAQAWSLAPSPMSMSYQTCIVCTAEDPSNQMGWCVLMRAGESLPHLGYVFNGVGVNTDDKIKLIGSFEAKLEIYKHPNYKRRMAKINTKYQGSDHRVLIKRKQDEVSSLKCSAG